MRVQQNNKYDLTEIENYGVVKTIGQWAHELDLCDRQKNTVYRRHSKYNARTYAELFCDNLYSHRKSLEVHVCVVCSTTKSKKWRKSACSNCYARAFRYYAKLNQSVDISGYARLVEIELEK